MVQIHTFYFYYTSFFQIIMSWYDPWSYFWKAKSRLVLIFQKKVIFPFKLFPSSSHRFSGSVFPTLPVPSLYSSSSSYRWWWWKKNKKSQVKHISCLIFSPAPSTRTSFPFHFDSVIVSSTSFPVSKQWVPIPISLLSCSKVSVYL